MMRRRDFLRGVSALALMSASRAEAWFPHGVAPSAAASTWNNLPLGGGGYHTKLEMHSSGFFLIGSDTTCGVNGGSTVAGTINSWLCRPSSVPAAYQGTAYLGGDCYGLGVNPNNKDNFYFWQAPANANDLTYVWKTTNGGASWTQTGFPKITANGNEALRYFKNRQIAVDPNNSNVVYAGGPDNLYVSFDGGGNATTVSGVPAATKTIASTAAGVNAILFDATSGTTTWNPGGGSITVTSRILVSSCGNGIYQSLDGGQTWALLSGSPTDVGKGWMASDGWAYVLGIALTGGLSGLHRINPSGYAIDAIAGSTSGLYTLALDPGDPTHAWAGQSGRSFYTFDGPINGVTPPTMSNNLSVNFNATIADQVPGLAVAGLNMTEWAWDPLVATSGSNVTIAGAGSISWSDLPAGLNIAVGDVLRAHVTGTPTSYMLGVVTAYDKAVGGNLTLAVGNVYTSGSNSTIGNPGTASSTVTMGVSAPSDVAPGMTVFNNSGQAIGKVRSWVGTLLTIWYSSNAISNASSVTFSVNEGTTYLCPATGGSGAHSAWTITKERVWSAEGNGLRYYDAFNFAKSAIPLLAVDQSSGLESLGGNAAIWPPKPAPGLVVLSSDYEFHPIQSNPIGTTGASYLSSMAGAAHVASVMEEATLCWAKSDPTTLFGYGGTNFGPGTFNTIGMSTDGAKTWTAFAPPTSSLRWYLAATTPSNLFTWGVTDNAGYYSTDGGANWTLSTGTFPTAVTAMTYGSSNHPLDVDDNGVYYLFGSDGTHGYVYRSATGATWTKGATQVAGGYGNPRLFTVPGHPGHLFACNGPGGNGDTSSLAAFVASWPGTTGQPLSFSADGGDTWASIPNTIRVLACGVGAPKPGGSGYPSIWWAGWTSNVSSAFGIYRIDDFNPASPGATPTHTFTGDYVANRTDRPVGLAPSPDVWDWCVVSYPSGSGCAIRGSAGGSWPP